MKNGFVIGRFSMFHNAHYDLINAAVQECDKVIVFIGSYLKSRDPKDPFTFEERKTMISNCFSEKELSKILFVGLKDFQDDLRWSQEVQNLLNIHLKDKTPVFYTFRKDCKTSQYIDLFNQYEKRYVISKYPDLNATDLRASFFEDSNWPQHIEKHMPSAVLSFLRLFATSLEFEKIKKYHQIVNHCIEKYGKGPFYTADCLVKKDNKYLFIVRKGDVGEGQIAVPGGFIEPHEKDPLITALREFQEELGCSNEVLIKIEKGFIRKIKIENPYRSLRGDIRTTAFLFEIDNSVELNIQSTAEKETHLWLTPEEIEFHRDKFFEDHYFMTKALI